MRRTGACDRQSQSTTHRRRRYNRRLGWVAPAQDLLRLPRAAGRDSIAQGGEFDRCGRA